MKTKSGDQPAFPTCVSADNSGGLNHGMPGMTLRDYFAGQAMAGILFHGGWEQDEFVARCSYEIADKMLAERDKQS